MKVGTEFRDFFFPWNFGNRILWVFLFRWMVFGMEFRALFSSTECFGTEFRAFSVPRNWRNSDKSLKIRLFRIPRNSFFSENGNPSGIPSYGHLKAGANFAFKKPLVKEIHIWFLRSCYIRYVTQSPKLMITATNNYQTVSEISSLKRTFLSKSQN